ncbi:hypothetical protein RHS01_05470 [Rhizoctonia solani]|uniref:BZIP domain-containing protein n=1 Tax=Rhizoctonia solani TaxID=456999 RepID=A0A8H7ID35_9AGAM|nr:hypothetical protein RHS01_05470 [Rhizoctonia solani]
MSPLTRYVAIAPAPPRRPDIVSAPHHSSEQHSQAAISHFRNNTTSETRHHVDPDLSVLTATALSLYPSPPCDSRTLVSSSDIYSIWYKYPHTTASRSPHYLPPHSPLSDKHTFAVPRVPLTKTSPPTDSSSANPTDLLDNYIKMLSHTPNNADAVAPVSPAMTQDLTNLFEILQGGTSLISILSQIDCNTATAASVTASHPGNPTPHSTPFDTDYRTLEELITSPEFTSPCLRIPPTSPMPRLSLPRARRPATRPRRLSLITPTLLRGLSTPNLDSLNLHSAHLGFESLNDLLPINNESPISPSVDTSDLFSPNTSPLFSDSSSVRPEGVRSVSDPVKKSQPTGHRKNLTPEQLLSVEAPTQQRNYYGPSATSRKPVPAGFEERRAKIVAKRRRGLGTEGEELSEDAILNAAVEDKRRANTVAARRSRQRKLEYVKTLEIQLAEKDHEIALWKERAIAAEGMVRRLEGKE